MNDPACFVPLSRKSRIRESVLLDVLEIAGEVVDGKRAPQMGARSIWALLVEQDEEIPGELLGFVGLASEWEDSPEFRTRYEQDIVDLAAEVLSQYGHLTRPWPKEIGDKESLLDGFARVMEVLEDQLPDREIAKIQGLLAEPDFCEALISLCVQLEINEVGVESRPLSMIAAIGTYLGVDPGFWSSLSSDKS